MGCGSSQSHVAPVIENVPHQSYFNAEIDRYKQEIDKLEKEKRDNEQRLKDYENRIRVINVRENSFSKTNLEAEIEQYKREINKLENEKREAELKIVKELEFREKILRRNNSKRYVAGEINFNARLKAQSAKDKEKIQGLIRQNDGTLFEDDSFKYFKQSKDSENSEKVSEIRSGNDEVQVRSVEWLRPHQVSSNPSIGLENISIDEVKQGTLGDCWFLAALGAVSQFPNMLANVIREDLPLQGEKYFGYFKACFFQYGEWIDVYVDDKLPFSNGNLIYARNNNNKDNYWVPLLEKAYAKLMGGAYELMIGGHSERALIDLTGLIYVSFKPSEYNALPVRYAIEDEIMSRREMIGCCSIRFKKDGAKSDDDFDGHAYSILSINGKIKVDDRYERIYTIRNPHAQAKEGSRWESSNPVWTKIDEESKRKVLYDKKDILTWMNSKSIKTYFSDVILAYNVPLINKNGYLYEFKAEWLKENVGTAIQKLLHLKHFLLTIPQSSGRTLVVFNLLQEEAIAKTGLSGISVIILPVRNVKSSSAFKSNRLGSVNYLDSLPETFNSLSSRQINNYLSLLPGRYLILPWLSSSNQLDKLNYFLRVFSYNEIKVEEVYCEQEARFVLPYDEENVDEDGEEKNRYINILARRCNFCEQLIVGQFTISNNFSYHKECYDASYVCDNCNQIFGGNYYTMHENLKFCTKCYESLQTRVNSAKNK